MRTGVALAILVCSLAAGPARGQALVYIQKCGDIAFMGPLIALDYCTRAIKSGELSTRSMGTAHFNRGTAHAMRGDLDRAIADFNESIRYDAMAPEPDFWRATTFIERGNLYAFRKQYDAALADYDEAVRLDPPRAETYVRRGYLWLAKREPDRAIADFTEALSRELGDRTFRSRAGMTQRDERRYRDRSRHDSTAYLGRGQAHLTKGDGEAAMADFDAAIKANPANPVAFAQRALTRHERGDYDGAIADYSAIIRLNPDDAGAYRRRGAAWLAKGDSERATADFEAAGKVKPRPPTRIGPDLDVGRTVR